MKDLEDRVKEMYGKLIQKEEILQKIEKTSGLGISPGIIYQKRDVWLYYIFQVVPLREQELIMHKAIETLRSSLFNVIIEKNKLEVKNQVLTEKFQVRLLL